MIGRADDGVVAAEMKAEDDAEIKMRCDGNFWDNQLLWNMFGTSCHTNADKKTVKLQTNEMDDISLGKNLQQTESSLVIPSSSIEYPGTRLFYQFFEYSNFWVFGPSIRVLDCYVNYLNQTRY